MRRLARLPLPRRLLLDVRERLQVLLPVLAPLRQPRVLAAEERYLRTLLLSPCERLLCRPFKRRGQFFKRLLARSLLVRSVLRLGLQPLVEFLYLRRERRRGRCGARRWPSAG